MQLVHDVCPGPVASDIASDIGPIVGGITKAIMKLLFQNPTYAALHLLRLAVGDDFKNRTCEHHHLSDLRPAREDARDAKIQQWLWDETNELLKYSAP